MGAKEEEAMRYVVLGYKTEVDARGTGLPVVISGHFTLIDAVKSALKYAADGSWHTAFVAKLVK